MTLPTTYTWTFDDDAETSDTGGSVFNGVEELFADEGEDLFFDDDFEHDAIKDLLPINVPEAVRQSIYDRLRTSPGEFKARPEFGIGIADFVKKPRTQANLDQIRQRIIDNLGQDIRIDKLIEVVVQKKEPMTLKVYVKAVVLGQEIAFRPMSFQA